MNADHDWRRTRLNAALSDRYRIERELGAGGMGPQIFADGSRSTQIMIGDE
jgi:hypothetical protein